MDFQLHGALALLTPPPPRHCSRAACFYSRLHLYAGVSLVLLLSEACSLLDVALCVYVSLILGLAKFLSLKPKNQSFHKIANLLNIRWHVDFC